MMKMNSYHNLWWKEKYNFVNNFKMDNVMKMIDKTVKPITNGFQAYDYTVSFDSRKLTMQDLNKDGTIYKKVIKPGNGDKIIPTGTIWVDMTCYREYEIEPSISTYLTGKTAWLTIEDIVAIGLVKALLSMRVGERAQFLLDSKVMYGDAGLYENGTMKFEKNENCIFYDIELYHFNDSTIVQKMHAVPKSERPDLDIQFQYDYSRKNRIEGNVKFKARRFISAIKLYTRSIECLEKARTRTHIDKLLVKTELVLNLSNRSLIYLIMKKYDESIKDSLDVLKHDSSNVKALYRLLKVYRLLENYDESLIYLKRCRSLNVIDSNINREAKLIDRYYKDKMDKEKMIYKDFKHNLLKYN
ncbi:FK506-binding protein [Intoshia linei]|uniref:FK506-binding protein n=1 Tax=Intoshia linei TaxID=1819745 RepID=A0A177BBL1_9BILA|nr:FK506-binding protein [Intoshia linei]